MRHGLCWLLVSVFFLVSALCLCLSLLPSAAAEPQHPSSSLPTYYEILESSPSSSAAELKRAYRRLALVLHPDKAASASEDGRRDAEAAFIALSAAYEVLSDAVLRPRYDYLLTQHVHVYDDHIRDWAAFDPDTASFSRQRADAVVAGDGRFSFGGSRSYESARERWEREQAEEEREKRALLLALMLSLGVALLPLFFFYWRRLREAAASRRRKEEASEKLRQEQAMLVEWQHEKQKEEAARRKEERSRREELRRRREEAEREEQEEEQDDDGDDEQPDEGGENEASEASAAPQGEQQTEAGPGSSSSASPAAAVQAEDEERVEDDEDRPRRRGAAGDASLLSCDLCRKKFKSQQQSVEQQQQQQQAAAGRTRLLLSLLACLHLPDARLLCFLFRLDNHLLSNAHRKAVKEAEAETRRAARRA